MIKTIGKVIGIFIGILALIVLGFVIFIKTTGKQLDEQSKSFASQYAVEILTHQDMNTVKQIGTEEFIKLDSTKIIEVFDFYRSFGSFVSLDSVRGQAFIFNNLNGKSQTVGKYTADAKFEKATGRAFIVVEKVGDHWKLKSINVNFDPAEFKRIINIKQSGVYPVNSQSSQSQKLP